MKKPNFDSTWPENWKMSYQYDVEEMFGEVRQEGYTYAYQRRMRDALKAVQRVAAPPARVLDIAAGAGNFSLQMAELGYDVVWNDLRADLVEYVRLKHESGKIEFAPGNAFELGFDDSFDVVLITEIIEHVAHPDDFLAKVGRMVKPGGHVVMTTPNGGYVMNRLPKFSECPDPSQFESVQFKPNSDGHIFLLHCDEIPALAAKAGLKVEKLQLGTNPLTNGHMKTGLFLKVLPEALVRGIEVCTQHLPGFLSRRINNSMLVVFSKPVPGSER